ncbi:MAG TPA: hypothetical protein VEI83_13810 [Acidimicrobiales bacterium]|nr:hypothetical protein [Acidimicrobiales bacterium]
MDTHHHHGGGGSSGLDQLLQDLSSTLGLSASQIQQQLAAGSSLSQIATNQGVSQGDLLSAVEGVLSSGPGQDLPSNQLSSLANNIVNGTRSPTNHGVPAANVDSASSTPPLSTDFILMMVGTTLPSDGGNSAST